MRRARRHLTFLASRSEVCTNGREIRTTTNGRPCAVSTTKNSTACQHDPHTAYVRSRVHAVKSSIFYGTALRRSTAGVVYADKLERIVVDIPWSVSVVDSKAYLLNEFKSRWLLMRKNSGSGVSTHPRRLLLIFRRLLRSPVVQSSRATILSWTTARGGIASIPITFNSGQFARRQWRIFHLCPALETTKFHCPS